MREENPHLYARLVEPLDKVLADQESGKEVPGATYLAACGVLGGGVEVYAALSAQLDVDNLKKGFEGA